MISHADDHIVFAEPVWWPQVQKRVVLIGGKAPLHRAGGVTKGNNPPQIDVFNRHGWEVPPGEKQAASAYVNAKIIIKLISNVGKAGGSLQKKKMGPAVLPEFYEKVLRASVLGGHPCFCCFCCFCCWVVVIPRSWSSEQRFVCFLRSKN